MNDGHSQEKRDLRAHFLSVRRQLAPEYRAWASGKVREHLLASPVYRRAGNILAYASFAGEVETRGVFAAIWRDGKRLVLPRTVPREHRLQLYWVAAECQLVPGPWGIDEPDPEVCTAVAVEEVDLALLPGIAFDPRGARLGYGGGYYDRLLAIAHRPYLVGLAFTVQLALSLPTEPHDVSLDALLTEEGWIRAECC